jgi:hypothetical protein
MEVSNTIPPPEKAARRAYETHCIEQKNEKEVTVQATTLASEGPARRQGPNRKTMSGNVTLAA